LWKGYLKGIVKGKFPERKKWFEGKCEQWGEVEYAQQRRS
jgi:hypothetical protein